MQKLLLYFSLTLILLIFSLKTPSYNWDIIGYLASSYSYEGFNADDSHRLTFANLESNTTKETFLDLTTGHEYREAIANSAFYLQQQLPFYEIRVVYVSLINALSEIGLPKILLTHLISSISVSFGLFAFYAYFVKCKKLNWLTACFPLILLPFGLSTVSTLSTPDGLAFLWASGLVILFLTRNLKLFFVLLPSIVFVRTDLVILSGIFFIYFLAVERKWLVYCIPSTLLTLTSYFGINSYFGNYGWQTIIHHTLIEASNDPSMINADISLPIYINIVLDGLYGAFKSELFMLYLLTSTWILFRHLKTEVFARMFIDVKNYGMEVAHYIGLAYILIHFILFPVIWDRFFVAQYAITIALITTNPSIILPSSKWRLFFQNIARK